MLALNVLGNTDGKVFQVYNRKIKMKPTSSFKMSKANKFRLARILDPHKRGEVKRSLIQAQLMSEIKVKSAKEERKRNED